MGPESIVALRAALLGPAATAASRPAPPASPARGRAPRCRRRAGRARPPARAGARPPSPSAARWRPSDGRWRAACPRRCGRAGPRGDSPRRPMPRGWPARSTHRNLRSRLALHATPLLRRLLERRLAPIDAGLDLAAEVADEPLHRPGCSVAECADGMALDARRHVVEQVDLVLLGLSPLHPPQHAPHPAAAFAARRALAAALVLVEVGDAADGSDDVGRLVHDDDGRRAHARLELGKGVEVESEVLAGAG